MPFNKISLLSVEDTSISTIHIPHIQDLQSTTAQDGNDIFYHLGTDLGQTTFSNPNGGPYLTITENQASGGDLNLLIDHSATSFQVSGVTAPYIITFQFLTGFEIDLQAFRYRWASSSSLSWKDFSWEGSNDGISWDVIYSVQDINTRNNNPSTFYYEPILDNRRDYYSYIRLNTTQIPSGSTFSATSIELYGRLRNLTTGTAGFKTPGDRFESLLNVDTYNPRLNREVVYDGLENVWEARINQPWEVVNLTMTGDITLTTDDLRNPRFYILSPNGAARNITLPPPTLNDCIKFRNLDGSFDINIFEDGNPTPVVLSNTGKLQYEYVYDSVEWHVLG